MLTTYLDDISVLEALQAGARSYLTKDADHTEIASALRAASEGLSVFDSRVHATLMNAASRGSRPAQPQSPEPGKTDGAALPAQALRAEAPQAQALRDGTLPDGLTEREAEILRLIAAGLNNPEIAARLFVTTHTVKSHINRVFAKTGSRDRAAAIRYAHLHGLA